MKKEKTYQFEVNIISDALITATSEKKARDIIKESWLEENNLELEDNEIKLIAVRSEKQNKNGTKDIWIK
jgi:hypothetical protein